MKNKSWSKKLFLSINKQVGKNKMLDNIMFFCAYWFISLSTIVFFIPLLKDFSEISELAAVIFVTGLMVGISISWIVGWIWSHRRPIVEFPKIKTLITPLSNWKSFPSDHTFYVFFAAFLAYSFEVSFIYIVLLFLIAILVAFSRIYVGVHYPRDILGGFVLALIVSFIAPWVTLFITLPIIGLFF